MKSLVNFVLIFLTSAIGSGIGYGITAEEIEGLMDRREKFTLIDVRSNAAYKEAHIPAAINIPARLIVMKRLPPLGRVIVYGSGIDEGPVLEAVRALNEKPGILAEMLEGGISRWEAVNYPSTRKKGVERESFRYISYQELDAIVQSNPGVVLIDLRKTKEEQRIQRQSHGNLLEGAGQARVLTDLSREFSDAKVISAPFGTGQGDQGMGIAQGAGLSGEDTDHSKLYVLIDSGDGAAEVMAGGLKAAGIKRFVILAGGEESLVRKGQPELKEK